MKRKYSRPVARFVRKPIVKWIGLAGSIAGLITFVAFAWNYISEHINKTPTDREIRLMIAQGLFDYSNMKYKPAARLLKKAMRARSTYHTSILLWLAETESTQGHFAKAYELLSQYANSINGESRDDILSALALTKIIMLFRSEEKVQLPNYIAELDLNKIKLSVPEAKMLALLLTDDYMAFSAQLDRLAPVLQTDSSMRRMQYELWTVFTLFSKMHGDQYHEAYCRSILRLLFPEEYDNLFYTAYFPFVNLTLNSISKREDEIQTYEQLPKPWGYHAKELITLGMSMGSVYALEKTIGSMMSKQAISLVRDRPISFIQNGDLLLIISASPISVSPDEQISRDPRILQFKFVGKYHLTLVKLDKLEGRCLVLNYVKLDGSNTFWIDALPVDRGKYLVITTRGTGHIKNFYQIDQSNFIDLTTNEEAAESYHSFDFYWLESASTKRFLYNIEKFGTCGPNIARKMPMQRSFAYTGGHISTSSDRYYNPALALYESLNKTKLNREKIILNSIMLGYGTVKDSSFLDYVTKGIPCYQFSKIDEAYLIWPKELYPIVSCLVLRYPRTDDISNKDFDTFVLLVGLQDGKINILDIYRLSSSGGLLSLLE